ncbi:PA0069 family radical SAM protein [Sneathiella sp. CAU 1612]|uniref:PA0069 family radical SAM protein n=1 Tax=Sneathiella sedimenti TaxID=2816034 RepID=A0ABS3F0Z7_9PROT|nr:PA0069 family radical SAM protein [Sneathiella sedimenti]MBO0332181.1 PA0069 family radical SAM protein [Sneathiella sedimenti]
MQDTHIIPFDKSRRHGRGATANPDGRFEIAERDFIDDGWGTAEQNDTDRLKTTVTMERPKSIISRNMSPDLPFDRSVNAYRGCEHGCIYCYARPSHGYMNLSAGLDFESKLFAKPNAAELLASEISRPAYQCKPIALGTNTDPYQPIEKKLGITREIIELLAETRHPFTITTKSDLVLRDLDLLAPLAKDNLVSVGISVTTLDKKLARIMEPRASAPHKRLEAIETLSRAGVRTSVLASPMIPGLNDHELERILMEARAMGARSAVYLLLRLPRDVAGLFENWLLENFPDRAAKVMKLVRSTRDGKDYDAEFGKRMVGTGPYAALINKRFRLACQQLDFEGSRYDLATDLFLKPGRDTRQMDLF